MHAQRGLSKLTTIGVIAILVVVAVIAIPAWQRHQVRGQVDAAMRATDAAKLVVMEAATIRGGLASLKAADLGYNAVSGSDPNVASLVIGDGGRITLTTRNTGASPDPVLVLTPEQGNGSPGTASITWTCTLAAGDVSQVPANCRDTLTPSLAVPATATSSHSSH